MVVSPSFNPLCRIFLISSSEAFWNFGKVVTNALSFYFDKAGKAWKKLQADFVKTQYDSLSKIEQLEIEYLNRKFKRQIDATKQIVKEESKSKFTPKAKASS